RPDVVEAARAAAAAAGLTLDEWINRTILGIVGGYGASRPERRSEHPEGRWADPLSSISQNLKSAADAASAAGVSFEQWLSEAILSNTTAVARQGRTTEEPNLSLFRTPPRPAPSAPRVVPFPDPRAERTQVSAPAAAESRAAPPKAAASEPATAPTKDRPTTDRDRTDRPKTGRDTTDRPTRGDAPPAIRPAPVETPARGAPADEAAAGTPPDRDEEPAKAPAWPPLRDTMPIPDLPSFPSTRQPVARPIQPPRGPEIPD